MPIHRSMLRAIERRFADEYGAGRELFPFRVGGDWLTDLDARITASDDLATVRTVTEELARDSDRLYHPSEGPVPFERDGVMVRFRSRGVTREEENRIASLAYVPMAPGCPMVLALPAWNTTRRPFRRLLPLGHATQFGGAILTLPYHAERRPAGWSYAQPLVCADLGLTLRSMQQAVLDAMDAISVLRQLGHEHIVVLGFSIGAGISILLDAHDARPAAAINVLCADSFADCAWNGISTTPLRAELEKHIDLATLREVWRPLEFGRYVARMRRFPRIRRSFVAARHDHTFPCETAQRLRQELVRHGIDHRWKPLTSGHYTLRYPPASFLFAIWFRRQLRDIAAGLRDDGDTRPAAPRERSGEGQRMAVQ